MPSRKGSLIDRGSKTHALTPGLIPKIVHQQAAALPDLYAEDKRVLLRFLAIARSGSFNQVARRFALRVDLLRKEIALLARRSGGTLFVLQKNVLALTPIGEQLHAAASQRLSREEVFGADCAAPLMRLTIPAPLLEGFLCRTVITWLRKDAGARLAINDVQASDAVSADVMLWFSPPGERAAPADWILQAQRLTSITFQAYIAGSYANKRIIPGNLFDLDDYMLAQCAHYHSIASLQPWNQLIEQRRHGVVHVSSNEMLRELIRWSGCIGLLPEQACYLTRNFAPLPGLFSEPLTADVWVGINGDSRHLDTARLMVASLTALFEPQ